MKKMFFAMLSVAFLFLLFGIRVAAQQVEKIAIDTPQKILPIAEWGLSIGDLGEIERRLENIFLKFEEELAADSIYSIRPGVTVERGIMNDKFGLSMTLAYKFETENGYEVTVKFTNEKKRENCLQVKTFSFFVNKKGSHHPDSIKSSGVEHYIPLWPICAMAEKWEPFSSDIEKEKLRIEDGKLIVEAHDYGGYDMISALIEAERRIKKGG